MARRNGKDADGTPIIRETGEIDELFRRGYVIKLVPPESHAIRYALCPVVKDPTNGGIAPDQFLNYEKRADCVTQMVPAFLRNFQGLQRTGDWDG